MRKKKAKFPIECLDANKFTLSFSQPALQHYIPNLLLFAWYDQILPFSWTLISVEEHIIDNPHAIAYTESSEKYFLLASRKQNI